MVREAKIFFTGLFMLVLHTVAVQGQTVSENIELAQQFFENEEYEKAADLYEKLTVSTDFFFDLYEEYKHTLRLLEDEKKEKSLIEKAYQLSGKDPVYLIDLALFYDQYENDKSAQRQFSKALNALKENVYQIQNAASKLMKASKLEWAKEVYLKGKEIFRQADAFDLELAYLSGRLGDFEGMVQSLILYIQPHPDEISRVIDLLDDSVTDLEKGEVIEENLLRGIGKNKDSKPLIELLAWLYNKQEDYASALDQLRSLDILQNLGGTQVLAHARLAFREKDYRTAVRAYKYITQKGSSHPYYTTAALELIGVQKEIVLQSANYDTFDLLELKESYQNLISENVNPYNTTLAKINLAELEAKYLHQLDSAIALLEGVISNARSNKDLVVQAKLALGDYYIMNGEHWESTLLYTQVEKDYKGTPLGEEAKYRNARLAYFKGDFDWALTILKMIKGNTFELISNDAIKLATFISDNYNQDYEEDKAAMKNFSNMELLFFQNRLDEAEQIADLMMKNFAGHPIEDDIYFMKAKIARKKRDYVQTEKYLLKVIEEYPKSFMTDDAVFQLAELYENQLESVDKAKKYYEKILLDYPDSVFTIEARKRYRLLRGDQL